MNIRKYYFLNFMESHIMSFVFYELHISISFGIRIDGSHFSTTKKKKTDESTKGGFTILVAMTLLSLSLSSAFDFSLSK